MHETNEAHTLKTAVIKTLAVLGFFITVLVLIFLVIKGITHAPGAFSRLASLSAELRVVSNEMTHLSLATEKTVVNSGDTFQISWTDMKKEGSYDFSYGCTSGIALSVRSAENKPVTIPCEQTLNLPASVHGLFLTLESKESRFTDVPLFITFNTPATSSIASSSTKVTVVNATIAQKNEEPKAAAVTLKPSTPTTASVPTYTDLSMTVLGSGVLKNAIFSYTTSYSTYDNTALRFDVKNIGTKTSAPWYFTMILPSGEVYTSPIQSTLNPMDHIEFTLGFYLPPTIGSTATISGTIHASDDTVQKNNTLNLTVPVR